MLMILQDMLSALLETLLTNLTSSPSPIPSAASWSPIYVFYFVLLNELQEKIWIITNKLYKLWWKLSNKTIWLKSEFRKLLLLY